MGGEFINQDNLNANETPGENESAAVADFTPAPTVYQFKLALLEKIRKYKGGGIKGVWKAISPNIKFQYSKDSTGNIKVLPRLIEKNFIRQVGRLKDKSPEEKSATIMGNIILLLNILEILEIKTVKDLFGKGFIKPDIQALIIAANANSDAILEKIDALESKITLSMRNKPRIPNIKVCRDWEQILYKMKFINDMRGEAQYLNSPFTNINSWEFSSLLNHYSKDRSKDIQTAVYIYTLLYDYREYFSQDALLHNFMNNFSRLPRIEYGDNHKLIALAPLYFIYFFFLFHKRFINSYLSKNNVTNNFSPFIPAKLDINGQIYESKKIENILNGKNLTEYISFQNKEMQKSVMNILLLFEKNKVEVNALKDAHKQLVFEIINFFTSIYFNNANYDQSHFLKFIMEIKNMNDFYKQISLGKPFFFVFSEDDIENIINFKQRLENLCNQISKYAERAS